jgi:ATP-dependent helicase/nuclease subunit B
MPSVYSIPAELPFLDTLAAGLLDRVRGDPLALTRYLILLPTRRSARALGEAFLRASDGHALLLPRLVPVGDLDADEFAFEGDAVSGDAIALPPALPPLRRQLLLTQLVLGWGRKRGLGPRAPGQAAPLARELARFLDEIETARADAAGLDALAPNEHAEHWQQVVTFLKIVTEHWPGVKAQHGALDPAERRDRSLAARIAAWHRAAPAYPVIAAGIAAGIPAVADLVAAVACLPLGEIVLPGFDCDSEDLPGIAADPTHPQHLLVKLLARLEVEPRQVAPWPSARATTGPRRALVRAALGPADESHRWRGVQGIDASAIANLARLDCAGAQEEAVTIALLMRQCLETPGKTAALVTPDRGLARRVAAELRRWGIAIDDSAGLPLGQTPPGTFLRLILEMASEKLAPLPLLAALKHPLAAGGMAPEAFRGRARHLEEAVLRGPRPAPGIAGLSAALPADAAPLRGLVRILDAALAPLLAALAAPEIALTSLVETHIAAAETLAAADAETGADRLWREEAGEVAAQFVADMVEAARDFPSLAGAEYPALFEALLAGPVVRPRYGRHPRLAIWGLLEARLQQADLMILGGLNEGVWPPRTETDPFLSRPMRAALGLPSPEQRVGQAAHDFAQALGAREAVLTRAARIEGAPTVPSRWLLRLETVLRAAGLERALEAATEPLRWQARLDDPGKPHPAKPPAPCPAVALRPRQLSVTQIETLIRDPYSVYARTILRLKRLEDIDAAPDAADRGTFIHHALDRFLRDCPGPLADDALALLLALGRADFFQTFDRPELKAFWWPRFERVARWFVRVETARRGAIAETRTEIGGRLTIAAPAGLFLLTAKADRIDRRRDGGVAIVDYKTGGLPQRNEWESGFAPQLPLEAAIAETGGFDGVPPVAVTALEYWRMSGNNPPGEIKALADDASSLRKLIDAALPGLETLVGAYDDPAMPYRAVPRAERAPRFNDYAHLSRFKEWSVAEDPEE